MTPKIAVVLTTVANDQQATELGNMLLSENLAACVQEIQIKSRYRWKGGIQCEPEVLMLVKTAQDRVASTIASIRRSHKYELPEIIVLPVDAGLEEYLTWVTAETRTS